MHMDSKDIDMEFSNVQPFEGNILQGIITQIAINRYR
jgi:hypothetical protein